MKLHYYFGILLFFVFAPKAQSQCVSSFIYSYTGITNFVWFQDKSTAPAGWQRDYTHWNFNDGSGIDLNQTATHTFPLAQTYNVVKETKFSDPGNPSSFCITKDSMLIDAGMSNSNGICYPHLSYKVKWLTGDTYGVSSYISGPCPYILYEVAVDTGNTTQLIDPMPGIYVTQQHYFTYTLPMPGYPYTVTNHISYADPNSFNGKTSSFFVNNLTPHTTPSDCNASFFMMPADSTGYNWTIQDFSTGDDSLSYQWDFGDGTTSTLAAPSHTYSSIGLYTVCLTVSSGTCSNTYCETAFLDTSIASNGVHTLNVQKMIVTGLKENKTSALALKVFPNPAGNELNISYPTIGQDYAIVISNQLGQVMFSRKVNNSSMETITLPIGELANGLYQVHISSDSGSTLAKTRFVKQ